MILTFQSIVYILVALIIVINLCNIYVYLQDKNQQSTTLQYVNLLIFTHVIFIALCIFLLEDSTDICLYNPYLLFYAPLSYVTIWDLVWPYKSKTKVVLVNFIPTSVVCIGFLSLQYLAINSLERQQYYNDLFLGLVGCQLLFYCLLDYILLRKKQYLITVKNKTFYGYATIYLQSLAGLALFCTLYFCWHAKIEKLVLTTVILSCLFISTIFVNRVLVIDKKNSNNNPEDSLPY
ncbi:hypothetical protein [Myroides sp. LJL119]